MPAFDPSLATLEQARDWCKVTGTSQDRFLTELILAASLLAEDETGERKLKSRVYALGAEAAGTGHEALVVNGSGTFMQCVKHYPVTSVTKVEFLTYENPETWEEQSLVTYPVSIDSDYGDTIFFRGLSFPPGYRNVKVSMVAGYTPVPANLSLAIREMVQAFYLNRDKQLAGIASKTFEGQTVAYTNEDIPKQALKLLHGFVRHAAF